MGLDLHFGNVLVRKTIPFCLLHGSSVPLAQSLYKKAKAQLAKTVTSDCKTHLNHLSVQCKSRFSKVGDFLQSVEQVLK